ncbi:MAG: DUF4351 domain-containing protein [Candidatus Viridilinea halotolerans]|uniref:DUF4351 domain-containing protein n=1 Tax=Candidatus Viridilinea halotolerans TaxID=2491704 RepID=A0A426TQX6_9CHLR|nr:MAG: DUF4351 domain-containing protein [Candidatus Viridilinea halotolerans]
MQSRQTTCQVRAVQPPVVRQKSNGAHLAGFGGDQGLMRPSRWGAVGSLRTTSGCTRPTCQVRGVATSWIDVKNALHTKRDCLVSFCRIRKLNEQVRATIRQIEQEELGMATFVTSFEELAGREGEARGLVKDQSILVLSLLERRFGPPPPEVQQRVATLSSDELLALGEALFGFARMDEVSVWLQMRGTYAS